jgi:elongation factor Tu
MPIEDVFSIKGRGTVGTVVSSAARRRSATPSRSSASSRTRRPSSPASKRSTRRWKEGLAGENVGILLRGVEKTDLERGQVLCAPKSITPHTKFEAEVYILTKEEGGRHTPFFTGYRPQFYFRTTDVTGTASCSAARKWSCRATT